MIFFLCAADAFSQHYFWLLCSLSLQRDIVVRYTLHESLLASENKGRNQPALLPSKGFLAHPLSFKTNDLLVKHLPLYLPAPPFSLPSSLTQHTLMLHCYCSQPSTSTPRPKTPPRSFPPRHTQTSVLACCPSQGHPCRRWSFYAYLSWFQKPPKIAVEWQNSAKSSILTVFVCRQQTIKSLRSYPHFMRRISILRRPRLDYPQLGSGNVTMWQPACLKVRKKGQHESSSHIISAIEKRHRL